MIKHQFVKLLFCISLGSFSFYVAASSFSTWIEFPGDPIYTPPFNAATLPDDYFPYVLYNKNKFDGNGGAFRYKMYHQSTNGIGLSYSQNGSNWFLVGEVVIDTAFHASVIYDKNGFSGTPFHYKMWYWTGNPSFSPPALAIKFTQSIDGITWTVPVATTQDVTFFLSDVTLPGQPFYQFYGFGAVIYNPNATSTPGLPFTFPYVTFFDSSAAEQAPQTTQEAVGLAYSSDGINWVRFGAVPVLVPSGSTADWDGKYAYRASVIQLNGIYHMYYSGSSEINNPNPAFAYTFGIGHATSIDGINWTRDPVNPLFTILDPREAWRSGRTLAPSVIVPQCTNACKLQMWFSGGTNSGSSFATAAIGYATSRRVSP